MAKKPDLGKTIDGIPITEELIAKYVAEAEAGFDVDEMLQRREAPLAAGEESVESVRLEPELHDALIRRAESDQETTSSVIRKALRKYLGFA